jgi:hypothetical protein
MIPQNTAPISSNPNCLQNALKGSPGVGRLFATNPKDPSIASHHGAHALSPSYEADAVTLAPVTGQVAKTHLQEGGANALYYIDVRITNRNSPLYGDYAVYFDLKTVSVTKGDVLGVGATFGTARPAGDPRNEIGLHTTLVHGKDYREFNLMRAQHAIGFPTKFFIDPLGPDSPINCPP